MSSSTRNILPDHQSNHQTQHEFKNNLRIHVSWWAVGTRLTNTDVIELIMCVNPFYSPTVKNL